MEEQEEKEIKKEKKIYRVNSPYNPCASNKLSEIEIFARTK